LSELRTKTGGIMEGGKTGLIAAAGIVAGITAVTLFRKRRETQFNGKTVIITGGSRGLGLVLARQFISEGARVGICARDSEELARAASELKELGGDVFALECDITDRHQVQRTMQEFEEQFGEIDVLVNNAGVIEVGPMEVMTTADFERAMNTHFWGPVYTTLAVLPGMKRRRKGRIVNISSIGGKVSVPHLVPYSASKFALVGLSEGLRAELYKDGIFVTTVCPGLMRTGSPRNADFKGKHRAEYAWFSISDALPITSISAERAASEIVAACARGDAEVVLSLPAKAAVRFHGNFPGLTADILGQINRLLPGPGGIGRARAKGKESSSAVSPSLLTVLSDRAALRNNEVG
jgi:NAD(P)-dependent dehydrogenase (short-subunit alcohol dehydrogenase family)